MKLIVKFGEEYIFQKKTWVRNFPLRWLPVNTEEKSFQIEVRNPCLYITGFTLKKNELTIIVKDTDDSFRTRFIVLRFSGEPFPIKWFYKEKQTYIFYSELPEDMEAAEGEQRVYVKHQK